MDTIGSPRTACKRQTRNVFSKGWESIQRQIAATDAQIDQLVYELYGLTADEIKIVEGATQ